MDADPDLQAEYWDRVPVVLLDGREHGYWRVEEERLLRDLGRSRVRHPGRREPRHAAPRYRLLPRTVRWLTWSGTGTARCSTTSRSS